MEDKILEPIDEKINTLLNFRFCIPIYQRPYNWGKNEILELFKDIRESQKKDEPLLAGTIYINDPKRIRGTSTYEYSVIDGQQRIMTLSLMLMSYYIVACKYNMQNEEIIKNIKGKLWKENEQEEVLIETEGIEKDIVKLIFDTAYSHIDDFEKRIFKYKTTNPIESRLIKNFIDIYENINRVMGKKGEGKQEFLKECEYVLNNIIVVSIVVNVNLKKTFKIFEDINSKGIKLDTIDLIKNYIFQNINDTEYNTCLKTWGNLIIKTNDRLKDYLQVYIRAYFRYYTQTINIVKFKGMCSEGGELKEHYKDKDLSGRIVELLTDMEEKVDYYMAMENYDAKAILGNNQEHKFKYYLECLKFMEYQHPKPLIFRAICEYKENKCDKTKNDLISIIKNSFTYMFATQTIQNGDSKDSITTFSKIMNNIYNDKEINIEKVNEIYRNNLNIKAKKEIIRPRLLTLPEYDRKESRILLSAYEFYDKAKQRIDYDKCLIVMQHAKEIERDHIAPKTGSKENDKCYYYPEEIGDKKQVLRLKKGNDFKNIDGIAEGMDYEAFKKQVLNVLGNLRLIWKSENGKKSNEIIKLPKYKDDFNDYKHIKERGEKMANILCESELFKID